MSNKKDLNKTIMKKIEKEGIKIRSKFLILAEKLSMGSALVLSVIISALFINLILYWLKTSQNLDFLSFGSLGVLGFLESFPYLWLVIVLFFLIIAGLLLKKYDISYKKPYKWLVLGILFLAVVTGSAAALSGANEKLAQEVSKGRLFPLRPFYGRRYDMKGKNAIIGQITGVNKNSLAVSVKDESIEVVFDNKTCFPDGQDFQEKDWIRAVGKQKNNSFYVFGIRKINGPYQEPERLHRKNKSF